MNKTRRAIGFIVAIILMIVTAPLILSYKMIEKRFKREELNRYFYQIAVSMSQFYAAFTYETEDWTTSSRSYIEQKESIKAKILRGFIDLLLGKQHCYNSYINESKELKKER